MRFAGRMRVRSGELSCEGGGFRSEGGGVVAAAHTLRREGEEGDRLWMDDGRFWLAEGCSAARGCLFELFLPSKRALENVFQVNGEPTTPTTNCTPLRIVKVETAFEPPTRTSKNTNVRRRPHVTHTQMATSHRTDFSPFVMQLFVTARRYLRLLQPPPPALALTPAASSEAAAPRTVRHHRCRSTQRAAKRY